MMVIDSAKCLYFELQHNGLRPGLAARRKGRFDPCVGYNIGGEAINKTHAEYSRLYLHETFLRKSLKKVCKRLGFEKNKPYLYV